MLLRILCLLTFINKGVWDYFLRAFFVMSSNYHREVNVKLHRQKPYNFI
jgi:hypothetical protein